MLVLERPVVCNHYVIITGRAASLQCLMPVGVSSHNPEVNDVAVARQQETLLPCCAMRPAVNHRALFVPRRQVPGRWRYPCNYRAALVRALIPGIGTVGLTVPCGEVGLCTGRVTVRAVVRVCGCVDAVCLQ